MGAATPFIDQAGALDEALEQHPLRVIKVTLERMQIDDPRPYPLRDAAFADVIHFFVDTAGR